MTDDVKKLGEPITLEQLRGMDGEPVWSDDGDWSTWGIVSVQKITPDKDKVFFCGVKHGIRFMFDVEKEGFKLHRYLPVKLDDWEPCEYCNGERTPYQHTHSTKLFIDTFGSTRTLVTECSGCPPYANCCMKDISVNSAFPINFCPNCGRPMTEGARAMLEKRLRGCK